jgi:hypothetical protein
MVISDCSADDRNSKRTRGEFGARIGDRNEKDILDPVLPADYNRKSLTVKSENAQARAWNSEPFTGAPVLQVQPEYSVRYLSATIDEVRCVQCPGGIRCDIPATTDGRDGGKCSRVRIKPPEFA